MPERIVERHDLDMYAGEDGQAYCHGCHPNGKPAFGSVIEPCDHCAPLMEMMEAGHASMAGQIVELMTESPIVTASIQSERQPEALDKIPVLSDTTLKDLVCAHCQGPKRGIRAWVRSFLWRYY